MQAVRNAIIYEYNNGLVEGSVNKLVDRVQQTVEEVSIRLTIPPLFGRDSVERLIIPFEYFKEDYE